MIKLKPIIVALFITASTLMAATFYPAPANINSLNAENLTSGTLPMVRLNSAVVTNNYNQGFVVSNNESVTLKTTASNGVITLSAPSGGVASGGRVIIDSYAPVQVSPSIQCVGAVQASGFSGDGSAITGLTIPQIAGLQATLDAKQKYAKNIDTIANLSIPTGNIVYTTGLNSFSRTPIADMGRVLIAVPSVASFRSVLGLSTISNVEFGGLVGTKTNNKASTGNVGEHFETYFVTSISASGIGDLSSYAIPTGDWDISVLVNADNATAPAFTLGVGISPYPAGDDTDLNLGDNYTEVQYLALVAQKTSLTIPKFRVSVAAKTTYYLKYTLSYTGDPFQMSGKLYGRRVR